MQKIIYAEKLIFFIKLQKYKNNFYYRYGFLKDRIPKRYFGRSFPLLFSVWPYSQYSCKVEASSFLNFLF